MSKVIIKENELYHYGVEGMKWGVRRYQNPDGTYTNEGKIRYFGKGREAGKMRLVKDTQGAHKLNRLNYKDKVKQLKNEYKTGKINSEQYQIKKLSAKGEKKENEIRITKDHQVAMAQLSSGKQAAAKIVGGFIGSIAISKAASLFAEATGQEVAAAILNGAGQAVTAYVFGSGIGEAIAVNKGNKELAYRKEHNS